MKRVGAAAWILATALCLAGLYAAIQQPVVEPAPMGDAMSHADHRPRHGGIFFMAPDSFHHLEGTLTVDTREFRLYLYDNFTRPMDARQFQARIGTRLLTPAVTGEYLSTTLDRIEGSPPHLTAFVRFDRGQREDQFDFVFVAELLQ